MDLINRNNCLNWARLLKTILPDGEYKQRAEKFYKSYSSHACTLKKDWNHYTYDAIMRKK